MEVQIGQVTVKTLMLAKTEGRRRREWQRTRWLDGITTQWTWVWASSGRWWRTRKPGMLQSMGLPRVGHDLATECQQQWFKNVFVVVVQLLNHFQLFVIPWTAAGQASLSFTISQSLLKLMSIELVIPSNHIVLCHPLLLMPSIFCSIRVFSNELALCIKWPKYWSFSFSIVLLTNIQGLFSFGLTGLISLQSKGLSKVICSTTVWKHQFFDTQSSLWFNVYTWLLGKP